MMKYRFLFLLFFPLLLFSILLFNSSNSFAQDVKWNAHWIMHPDVQPQDHAVILFRKSFDLPVKPGRFVVHLSADNHYRLFVNGTYICRGPARGDIAHWFYETLDISPWLEKGKNTLAVEVINWGPKRSFTFFSQMSSFIMQGETDAEKAVNTYGGSWKCIRNRAVHPVMVEWMTDRNTIDFGLYVGNPTDSIKASEYPWGWETKEFDDNLWKEARWCDIAGGRETQHAGGILYSGGKLLIPRRTGMLMESPRRFAAVLWSRGIAKDDSFIRGTGDLIIPANSSVSLLIDHGIETTGYPELLVSGGKDAHLRVMYAENLITQNHSPKGNRNDTEGKRMVGIKDIFIPDGGEKRLFKPTYLRAFRFIQLDIHTASEPLVIEDYYQVNCTAPIDLKARFETGDMYLDWMIEAGWRTVSICAQDMLLSDAYYEQMQYTGDSRVHNLTLLTLSGDDRLTRNSLIQFDQSRIPEGLTYACYPNPFHLIIPSYSLIWIDQVYDYMMWKDDSVFLKEMEPGIRSVLGWYERKLQKNGLLGNTGWWSALAWPRHYAKGEPPEVYLGNNTLYSLHYAYTLRHAAEIFRFTGQQDEADKSEALANHICESATALCKGPDGFYRESPSNPLVSQITNIMAILSGAVEGKEAQNLMKRLLEPKDWFGQVDLFLHLYLFEALNITGLQEYFQDEISEWKLMKERGMTTFAEVPLEWGEENQRSECHPWSTAPDYFFFRTVCGIKPVKPGHRVLEISPSMGKLEKIYAIYPHHLGNIKMELNRRGTKLMGSVDLPDNISEAIFIWNSERIILKKGLNLLDL